MSSTSEIEEVDLFLVVDLIRRRWLLGTAVWVAIVMSAIAVQIFATPVYRSEILMAPSDANAVSTSSSGLLRQLGDVAAIPGLSTGAANSVDESIAVLRSRTFTEQYIADGNLLPLLFPGLWDSQSNHWNSEDSDDIPSLSDGFRVFDEDIRSISKDQTTGLVTLAVEWRDPEVASQWATQLVDRLNEKMREDAIHQSTLKLGYLHNELDKTSAVELRQSIYNLIETEIRNSMIASVNKEYAFRVLDPASVPDRDDPIWPRGRILIGAGIVGGGIMALLIMLLVDFLARYRIRRRQI